MSPQAWIPTLLLIAVLALLPSWLVGCAALGAALGMWVVIKLTEERKRREEQGAEDLRKSFAEEWSKATSEAERRLAGPAREGNVVEFRKKNP